MVTERDFFINCVFKLKWRSGQVLTCFGQLNTLSLKNSIDKF